MAVNFLDLFKQLDTKLDQVNKINAEAKDLINLILNSENKTKHENTEAKHGSNDLQETPTRSSSAMGEIVRFNVGGKIFSTAKSNITKKIRKIDDSGKTEDYYEPNFLECLVDGILIAKNESESNAIFIDRNPRYFSYLLDYLRMADSVDRNFQLPKTDLDLNGLLEEAEYFNVQGLVHLIQASEKSSIVSPAEFSQLMDLVGFENKASKWKMIYRATRDGFGSENFHAKCDNFARILILINSSNSYVFGGYSSVCWDKSGEYKDDPSAFLFSLINPDNKPIKLCYNGGGKAIFCHANNGPTFGAGHDLFIATHANTNKNSHTNLGNSFKHSSLRYESDHSQCYFNGSYNFQVNEIEVFHMIN